MPAQTQRTRREAAAASADEAHADLAGQAVRHPTCHIKPQFPEDLVQLFRDGGHPALRLVDTDTMPDRIRQQQRSQGYAAQHA